jgi:CysZ protein
MLIDALQKALRQVSDPRFRSVLLRAVAFTLALYVVLGWAAWRGIEALAGLVTAGWLHSLIAVALGLGAALLAVWLAVPIAALFVGLFLDEVAEAVERRFHPPPGRALSVLGGLLMALRFLAIVVGVNLLFLPVYLFVPGPNAVLFYAVNAYLIGREYFEMVGARHAPLEDVRALRRRRAGTVFLAGLVIALPLSVPILNLVVPILGTAFMVHVYKALAGPKPPPVVAGRAAAV